MSTAIETTPDWIHESWIGPLPDLYGVRRERREDGIIHPIWTREQERSHRVYFVEAAAIGVMKVGFTTDIDTRLRTLRTASPHELRIEALVVGSYALEAHLHRRLRKERMRGEWYAIDSDRVASELVWLYEQGLVEA